MRVLTGFRPTGKLHIGHYYLLKNLVEYIINVEDKDINICIFIADLHALIQFSKADFLKEIKELNENIKTIKKQVKVYLKNAIEYYSKNGQLNDKNIKLDFIVQSYYSSEIFKIKHILDCITPINYIDDLGIVKDAKININQKRHEFLSLGFYNYITLQIADIIFLKPDIIVLGKDQMQNVRKFKEHYEFLHMLVNMNINKKFLKFLKKYVSDLKFPKIYFVDKIITLNGKKMSKSIGNVISPFDKNFKMAFKKLKTDGHKLNQHGDYTKCEAFIIYESVEFSNKYLEDIKNYCNTFGSQCSKCKLQMIKRIEQITKQ